MEIVDLVVMVHTGFVGAIGKYRAQTTHNLALPGAHLVRMNLMLGSYLLDRLVTTKRIQRHASLELRCKSSSGRHLVFLR